MLKWCLALATLAGCAASGGTVYVGPTFLTADPARPEARAVEVDAAGRIVALYDRVPAGKSLTRLHGALAVPGMHDAHLHVLGIGRATARVQLLGASSPQEVVARVKAHGAKGPVVRGRGWDQSRFPGKTFPTADQLAPLGDDRPVVLTRVDGHAVWVNRKALKMAGIDRTTKDPQGGKILRDAAGEPTGVLVDNAIDQVTKKLPKPSLETRLQWFWRGLHQCRSDGLTAVHDMGVKVDLLDALVADVKGGQTLPVRLFVYLDGHDDASLKMLQQRGPGPKKLAPRVWLMGAKLYADGAMGSRGAALLEDYSDAPGNSGHLLLKPAELTKRVGDVHRAGYQVAIHAIGDLGVRTALNAIEAANLSGPRAGPSHRIEHAQLAHPKDFARLKSLGVVASMQPTHATSDMRWAEQRVGAVRILGAYAWRTMLREGIQLAFGSDSPIESHKPGWGLYAAVTRQDHAGHPPGGWRASDTLTIREALDAFSRGAARAVGQVRLGRLTIGAPMDVTVFPEDIRKAAPATWLNATMRTLVGADLR